MNLTIAAQGAAAPGTVWNRYVHPARWAEWSPQIRSVDCTDQAIRPGTEGTVHGPCGVGVGFQVLDVDHEKRSWTWRVRFAGIGLTLTHDVQQLGRPDDGGARTTLGISGPAPLVVGYAPIARLALTRLVRLG